MALGASAIDLDPHGGLLDPAGLDVADAGDTADFDEEILLKLAEVVLGFDAHGDGKAEDGACVGVPFPDVVAIDIFWEGRHQALESIAHLVVDVGHGGPGVEAHPKRAVLGGCPAAHSLEAFDGGKELFGRTNDLVFDLFGCGVGVDHADIEVRGGVAGGEELDGDLEVGDGADHAGGEDGHHDGHRASQAQFW